jgi:hypothetical protein
MGWTGSGNTIAPVILARDQIRLPFGRKILMNFPG